ncbi:MAG: hypothetical protein HZA51_17810 [Planctomycetes bacterium]|nr:hypothetical protein [Planctomycetota bacterium]
MRPALVIGGDELLLWGYPNVRGVVVWDGSTFAALGEGIRGIVHSLCVFDDGSGPAIFAGGSFSLAGGATANNLAKWNGTAWQPLGAGVAATGRIAIVRALTVMQAPDGPVLVAGGEFDEAGGIPVQNIATWNGVSWGSLGIGLTTSDGNASVLALSVFDDGRESALYAGGVFNIAGDASPTNIAKWNGIEWTGLSTGTDNTVRALGLIQEGEHALLCVGGLFTTAGGLNTSRIARWGGTLWTGFGNGIASYPDGDVSAVCVRDQGKAAMPFAAGSFRDPNSTARSGALNWNGQDWMNLGQVGAPLNNSVNAMLEWDDDGPGPMPSAVIAGGFFTQSGTTVLHRLAKYSSGQWSDFQGGVSGFVFGPTTVFCMTKFDEDGAGPEPECLYIGGDFSSVGGVATKGVAKWNPVTRNWSGYGNDIHDQVYGLAFYDDGNGPVLYAGGYRFVTVNGVAQSVAKWNKSKGHWEKVGQGIQESWSWVRDICVYPNGPGGRAVLVATGAFEKAGTVEALGIAQWNGKHWAPIGKGLGRTGSSSGWGYVLYTAEESGIPMLFVGGGFTSAGSNPALYLARWDGAEWHGYPNLEPSPSISKIDGITMFDDGSGPALYVAGSFRARIDASNVTNNIAKWTGTQWQSLGVGLSFETATGAVNIRTPLLATGELCGKQLFVGGRFAAAGGISSPYVSAWTRQPPRIDVESLNRRLAIGADLHIHADVEVCGPGEYQWRRYAIPLQNSKRVTGATSATLQIKSMTESDAGVYDLVAIDQIGRTTSHAVLVIVEPVKGTGNAHAGHYAE